MTTATYLTSTVESPHHPGMDRRRFLLTSLAGVLPGTGRSETQFRERPISGKGSSRSMIAVLIVNVAWLAAITILFAHYWSEKRILRAFLNNMMPRSTESHFAMAVDLAGVIHAQAPRGEDPPFIPIRLLDILGATHLSLFCVAADVAPG